MIPKKIIPMAMICVVAWSVGVESNTIAWAQEVQQDIGADLRQSEQMPEQKDAAQLFMDAYHSYHRAKLSTSLSVQSEAYADAIRDISKACTIEPKNVEYLMLASQVYRSKGGSSYAKDYFARAEKILRERIDASPDDVHANLDYAIACLAGEGRFSKEYQKKGEKTLDKTIRLCESEFKSKHPDGGIVRALGMAYLLKGQQAKAEKMFVKAAELGSTSRFYYALYEDTVKKGTWIWPVGKEGAIREFCMYCLLDTSRNYSL